MEHHSYDDPAGNEMEAVTVAPGSAATTATTGTQTDTTRPQAPLAGIIFGETIYWMTILSGVIALLGITLAMLGRPSLMQPHATLDAILAGHSVTEIWQQLVGGMPDGHWYLSRLTTADGLMGLGLALGVFSVIPAAMSAAWILYRQGWWPFAILAAGAAAVTGVSVLGLIPLPMN